MSYLKESHLWKFLFPAEIHSQVSFYWSQRNRGNDSNSHENVQEGIKIFKVDSWKYYVIGVAYDLLLFWFDKQYYVSVCVCVCVCVCVSMW